jgi:chromosome segregation ATPase
MRTMTSQPLGGASRGDPGRSSSGDLPTSLERLDRRIDALDRALQARATEAEALSPLIERVVSRVSEIRELLGGIQSQLERTTSDVDDLRSRQDDDARSLREAETATSDRLRTIEASVKSLGALESAQLVERIDAIDRRIDTIDRPAEKASPDLLARVAEIERRIDTQPPSDGDEEMRLDSIAQLERRLDALEPDEDAQQALFDRIAHLEQRLSEISAETAVPPANDARLEQAERSIEILNAAHETDLPAALGRIDDLEAQVEALRAVEVHGEAGPLSSAAAQPENSDQQHSLQVLREESIGIAMASVNDLYRRVDQLDRQEEALSRIINLIVERSRLIPETDLAGEGGSPR